jgi:hypothetical protein
MARCSCVGGQCNCLVVAGEGQVVTGSGHPSDPYIITNTGVRGALQVQDSTTVDLSLFGNGVLTDPYTLSANATIRLFRDMLDMAPGETADPGDTIIVQSNGTWKLGPPPVTPAGAVNATGGITGTGAVVTPLQVAVSGLWGSGPLSGLGSDDTIGTVVYVDSAGKVRAAPQQVQTLTWDAIQNKPTTFPTTWDLVTGKPTSFPTTWSDVSGKPATFPSTWATVSGKPTTSTLDGRTIYVQNSAPTAALGVNGDITFQY